MIEYRTASLSEVHGLMELAAAEGWNPGLDDPDAFFLADRDGFFGAFDGETHCGGISVVNHNPHFAFLGLYLMRPEYRGKGLGFSLWKYAIAHARERTIGLDGVEDQQANYAASGFETAGNTTRFTGKIPGKRRDKVREVRDDEISKLIKMEAQASGVRKPSYLATWFQKTLTRRTFVFEDAGQIQGFCTMRQCLEGFKVGPFFARDTEIARQLLETVSAHQDSELTLDVPGSSRELEKVCQTFGMQAGFRTARMYRGPFTPVPETLFAVGSLELG